MTMNFRKAVNFKSPSPSNYSDVVLRIKVKNINKYAQEIMPVAIGSFFKRDFFYIHYGQQMMTTSHKMNDFFIREGRCQMF